MSDRRRLAAILRQDLASFIRKAFPEVSAGEAFLPNWHVQAIAHHLALCELGEIKRLIITLPPRNLKSICASVAFPAWALGRNPQRKIICASYSQDLAEKLSSDCRSVMEAGWYGELFPETDLPRGRNTRRFLRTGAGGFRFATSVTGTVRGLGGDMIIIDDPMKGLESISPAERLRVAQWYDGVIYGRLNNKNDGVIILIMQRIHESDLVGHVLEKGDAWVHLNIPAIAPVDTEYELGHRVFLREAGEPIHDARESLATLEAVRRNLGAYHFASQYQQEPIPLEGNLFRRSWFKYYEELPTEPFDMVVQSWDTGMKAGVQNDYSVGTTWGVLGTRYYLLDVTRGRWEFPELKREVYAASREHSAEYILIEDAASGTALAQALRREDRLHVIAIPSKFDKIVRATAESAKVEAGSVLLPREADFLDEFLGEVAAFPGGRHDDQVDSMTLFLNWVARRQFRERARLRPDPVRPPGRPIRERPKGARRNV